MRVRRIDLELDYPVLKTWWARRGGVPPAIEILPDVGVIVEDAGMPVSCLFLYTMSNASVAVAEWEATNPDCMSPLKKIRALHMAFDFFEKFSNENQIRFVFSWTLPGRGDRKSVV